MEIHTGTHATHFHCTKWTECLKGGGKETLKDGWLHRETNKQNIGQTDGWKKDGRTDGTEHQMDGRKGRQQWMEREIERDWWSGGQAEIQTGSAGGTDRRTHGQDDGALDGRKDRWSNWMLDGQRWPVCPSVCLCTLSCLCPSICPSVSARFSIHQSVLLQMSISPSNCLLNPSFHLCTCQRDWQTGRWMDRLKDGHWQRDRRNGRQFVFPSTLQSANPFIFLSILLSLWPSDCLSVHRPTSPTVRRTNWQTRRQKDGPTHRPKAAPTAAQLEVLNWQYYLKESPFSQLKGLTSTPQQAHLLHNKDILRNILKMTIIPAYVFLHIDLQRFFVCFFSSIELLQPEQMKSVEQLLFCRSLCKQAGLKLHP